MLKLHYLSQSRAMRILWALEELGEDYQLIYYERTADFTAPASLKKIHPLGKSPILQDGELTLIESGAILEYLQNRYDPQGKFKTHDVRDAQDYLLWLHFAEGSFMPLLVFGMVHRQAVKSVPGALRWLAKKILGGIDGMFTRPRLTEQLDYIETVLQKQDYLAGSFSFADIQLGSPLMYCDPAQEQEHYPAIGHYLARLRQRPAFKRALAKEQEAKKVQAKN